MSARTYSISYPDGATHEVDADRMELVDQPGMVSFWTGETLVGIAHGWVVITSDGGGPVRQVTAEEAKAILDEHLRAHEAISGVSDVSRGHAEHVATHRGATDDGPVYQDETDELVAAALDHEQTSAPDGPGVSTDPAPDPEPGDVDATPPENPPSESTGADDPPADGGDSDDLRARNLEDRQSIVELSQAIADLSGTATMTQLGVWLTSQGWPIKVGEMTVEQRRAAIEWLEKNR